MLQSSSHRAQPRVVTGPTAHNISRPRTFVCFAGKGFGAKPAPLSQRDVCPCGSSKTYKSCCKPYHKDGKVARDAETTLRARFSAFVKKELQFLLDSFHPEYHSFQYSTEPGGATEKLLEDVRTGMEKFTYSNLKVHKVEADPTDERQVYVEFSYLSCPKDDGERNADGSKKQKMTQERSRFIKCADGVWRFVESQIYEMPQLGVEPSGPPGPRESEQDVGAPSVVV